MLLVRSLDEGTRKGPENDRPETPASSIEKEISGSATELAHRVSQIRYDDHDSGRQQRRIYIALEVLEVLGKCGLGIDPKAAAELGQALLDHLLANLYSRSLSAGNPNTVTLPGEPKEVPEPQQPPPRLKPSTPNPEKEDDLPSVIPRPALLLEPVKGKVDEKSRQKTIRQSSKARAMALSQTFRTKGTMERFTPSPDIPRKH